MTRRISGWLLAACAAWVPSQFALAQAVQPASAAAPAPAAVPTIQPPAALRADGIPPIPASIADAVGAYTEFRAPSSRAGTRPAARP